MHYLKKNIKLSILPFLVLTLAKTEVYFSLYDNPQKEIIKNINQSEAFINIAMYIFTDREIAIPLAKARERGVKVRLYLDNIWIKTRLITNTVNPVSWCKRG